MNPKPLKFMLVTPFTPMVGETLLAQREIDGTRVLTSPLIAVHTQADGSLLVETHNSVYPVKIVATAEQPR